MHRRSLRHIYIRIFSYFIDYVCHLLRLYCRRGPPCALNITLLMLGPSWMPLVSMLHFLFGVTLCGISPVRACIVGMAPPSAMNTLWRLCGVHLALVQWLLVKSWSLAYRPLTFTFRVRQLALHHYAECVAIQPCVVPGLALYLL